MKILILKKGFLFIMANINRQTESLCKLQDWDRQIKDFRVPLSKQFVRQR